MDIQQQLNLSILVLSVNGYQYVNVRGNDDEKDDEDDDHDDNDGDVYKDDNDDEDNDG